MQTTKSQALNAVLAHAGLKGAYSLQAAIVEINKAATHAIIDGNSRPFDDTRALLTKGVTKEGAYASNNQGVTLSALITAQKFSRDYYETLHANNGKFNKVLTADDKKFAVDYANDISSKFEQAINQGIEALTIARKEASAKTKATKEANLAATNESNIKAAEAEKTEAANTLTISDFLTAIKQGDKSAIAMAQTIGAALHAYETSKANTQHAKNGKKLLQATEKIAA